MTDPVADDGTLSPMLIFSFDAETDGLYGEPWAIGAVVLTDHAAEVDRFSGMIDPSVVKDEWVRENIVPVVDLPRFDTREALLNGFWAFWMTHRENAVCVADFGSAVEAYVFREAIALDAKERMWLGPYPMHELGTLLLAAEIDPDIDRREMVDRTELVKHNPVDDAMVAAECWLAALANLNYRPRFITSMP